MLGMAQQPKTWLQKPWILCSGLWTMFLIWQKPQPFSISEHMKPLLINVNCGFGILKSLDSAHLFVWFGDPLQSVNLLLHREVWSYPLVHLIPSQFIDCLELLLNVIFVLTKIAQMLERQYGVIALSFCSTSLRCLLSTPTIALTLSV